MPAMEKEPYNIRRRIPINLLVLPRGADAGMGSLCSAQKKSE